MRRIRGFEKAKPEKKVRSADEKRCTRVVTNLMKGLEQGIGQMPNFPWVVDTIMANPTYRERDLVNDICDAFSSVLEDARDGKTFTKTLGTDDERMAALVVFFKGVGLNQTEVNRVMTVGIRGVSNFMYEKLHKSGTCDSLQGALDWQTQLKTSYTRTGEANQMSLHALIKCCDRSVLVKVAARNEKQAMLLYSITGQTFLLQSITSDENRTKVFASDLGL